MSYGLPTGTRINYGSKGFPDWVYKLGQAFGLKASTYPGHQETDRNEAGFAPNPQHLNRGIDWGGSVPDMQRFAEYCLSIRGSLEQVIWENPNAGQRIGVAGGRDVSGTGYYVYKGGYDGHRDHVHTRQNAPIPLPGGTPIGEQPMSFTGDPVWLEDVLRPALGDRLVVEAGWKDRGTGGQMGDIWGVMIHHTGNSRETVALIRDGRPDLSGPLSQCLIKPDGKCHLIAVGPCNHAGVGSYPGIGANNGNSRLIGFECAWPTPNSAFSQGYNPNERWPDAQMITMRDATAAVLKKLGHDSSHVIGHKEWAGASQGKWDPGNLSMPWFRDEVGKDLRGQFEPKPTVPSTPQPAPVLPPNYDKEVWDQLRIRWPMLGGQTVVEALAEVRDKVCGTNDQDKR